MSEKINNNNNIKQSFNRFDDNLCELLLSYLKINNKIKFECISKQWQQLVFNKQQKLIITCVETEEELISGAEDEIKLLANALNLKFYICYSIEKSISKLEIILRKFKSIKEIVFSGMTIEITGKLIKIIANNCHNLEKLSLNNVYFNDIYEEDIEELGLNCGQSLQTIVVSLFDTNNDYNRVIDSLLKFTPNIRSINYELNPEIIWKSSNYFLNLEEIYLDQSFTYEELKSFIDVYYKQIKKIHVRFNNNEIDLNESLLLLSRFESLVDLSALLEFTNEVMCSAIDNQLVMIGKSCSQLKNLLLYIDIEFESGIKVLNGQWFEILSYFSALKSCTFYLYLTESSSNDLNSCYGSIEALKSLKYLKHLSLDLSQLNDKQFESIDLYLPQLRSLAIITENCIITDESLHSFAKLQNLSVLKLKLRDNEERDMSFNTEQNLMSNKCHLTDSGVYDLISNCSNIKTIKLKLNSSISSKSIEEFINRANSCPKMNYNYSFASNDSKVNEFINSNNLPKNLKLKVI